MLPQRFRAILLMLHTESLNRLRISDQVQEAGIISDLTSIQAKVHQLVGVAQAGLRKMEPRRKPIAALISHLFSTFNFGLDRPTESRRQTRMELG